MDQWCSWNKHMLIYKAIRIAFNACTTNYVPFTSKVNVLNLIDNISNTLLLEISVKYLKYLDVILQRSRFNSYHEAKFENFNIQFYYKLKLFAYKVKAHIYKIINRFISYWLREF